MKPCPECGNKKLEIKSNEVTCKKCGLVIAENFFSGRRMLI
jgi:transcription initiation factor TFIIIB Brf1 subunit/transcription initiation factor TFIIB